jgi:phosphoserine phosphatase
MFAAVLICNPARPVLDAATVGALRDAWGGGEVRWLCPGVAAEFPVDRVPDTRWTAWEGLQTLGVDLCVVPAKGRRKRLLLADMDSTMIGQECIEIGFEGALRERVALLRGLPEAMIEQVFAKRITMAPGGAVLVSTMRAHGARAALVSGGFTAFTDRVAAQLGFDEHRANVLGIASGVLDGTVAEPILGREAKVQALHEISARIGATPGDAVAVGDGANDLGMLGLAGMGVAVHAKPAVQAQCDLRVNHGNLTALLYLQGYSEREFAK